MGLQMLETKLAELYKKPPQLPETARKTVAGALWWLSGLFGLLQLWMAWKLWDVAHYAREVDRALDALNRYYGHPVVDTDLGFFYYAAFAFLLLSAALYLLAAPALKAFKKAKGWNFVFYALLVEAVYSVLVIFSDTWGGMGDFIWALLVVVVAGYFIFQVRDRFKDSKTPSPATPVKK